MIYQLLVLDPTDKTHSKDALSLVYALMGYSDLWTAPQVREADFEIADVDAVLSVAEHKGASGAPAEKGHTFVVTLVGTYESIEPKREPLAGFLKGLDFDLLYVLRDQASEHIACELYPPLYRIENLLRGYLIRFMATQVGPEWWELTASVEMADKAKRRKKNERVFGKHVENSAYLIDFDELGELVYEQSSGFRTKDDILDRIYKLAETTAAIKALKEDLRSNYQKFFKESFADKGFKDRWTQFEALRNKIAHNNLFTSQDLVLGKRLATEITAILEAADTGATTLVISSEERKAIQEQVIARTDSLPAISEDTFLSELAAQERSYSDKPHGFVGISRFLNYHLTKLGYASSGSQRILEEVKDAGKIEVYHVPNPNEPEYPTAALRCLDATPKVVVGD